jgi:hypothetical protein
MHMPKLRSAPLLAIAAGGLVVGLALPAAAHEASSMINGKDIKNHSITGKKLKNNTLTGKQIKESKLGTVPKAKTLPPLKWHTITTFENGWSAFPDLGAPGWAEDAQGVIHLRGVLTGTTDDTVAFTFPAGVVTLSSTLFIPADGDFKIGLIDIAPDGSVTPGDQAGDGSGTDGMTDATSLDGISFPANNGAATPATTKPAVAQHGRTNVGR